MSTHQFLKSPAKDYLQDTEFIVWQERPFATILLNRYDLLFIPLSLIWLTVVILWEGSQLLRGGAPIWLHLASGVALFVGLHGLFGRLVVRYLACRNMLYVLTNQRVMILGGRWQAEPRTLHLREIAHIVVRQHPMNLESVVFTTAEGETLVLQSMTSSEAMLDYAQRMRSTYSRVSSTAAAQRAEQEQHQRGFLRTHYRI